MNSKFYDYIIAGAGCAGLSLAVHLIQAGITRDKKVLIVDKERKSRNDRTWCFWERDENIFETLVKNKWQKIIFRNEEICREMDIHPYTYKMISGSDFYEHCYTLIDKDPNIEVQTGNVEKIFSDKAATGIIIDGETIKCSYVFNSILFNKPELSTKQYWLLQHFKGWVIESSSSLFAPGTATLMDFRVNQNEETAFFYVLPFTEQKALVEYTIFGKQLLPATEYDRALKAYIAEKITTSNYTVAHEEFGVIPMTNYSFEKRCNNIIHIGTAGGVTKGSSGYTFYFIQKQSRQIIESLNTSGKPFFNQDKISRFHFYDSVLLNILHNKTLGGKEIFSQLFTNNNPVSILKFLNNESFITDELKIISSLPTLPFLKAAIKQIF